MVDAARREGEIVWYTTMSLDQSKEFMDRFLKKYPFLRPNVFRSGGGALLNRITTEAKAGKHLFDVVHGTGEIFLPLMELGLVAPYDSPEKKMNPCGPEGQQTLLDLRLRQRHCPGLQHQTVET